MTCTESHVAPRAGIAASTPWHPFRTTLRWILAALREPEPGRTILPHLDDRQRRDLGLPDRAPERLPADVADRLRILHRRF